MFDFHYSIHCVTDDSLAKNALNNHLFSGLGLIDLEEVLRSLWVFNLHTVFYVINSD